MSFACPAHRAYCIVKILWYLQVKENWCAYMYVVESGIHNTINYAELEYLLFHLCLQTEQLVMFRFASSGSTEQS
jgi:hypothetical protein